MIDLVIGKSVILTCLQNQYDHGRIGQTGDASPGLVHIHVHVHVQVQFSSNRGRVGVHTIHWQQLTLVGLGMHV